MRFKEKIALPSLLAGTQLLATYLFFWDYPFGSRARGWYFK